MMSDHWWPAFPAVRAARGSSFLLDLPRHNVLTIPDAWLPVGDAKRAADWAGG